MKTLTPCEAHNLLVEAMTFGTPAQKARITRELNVHNLTHADLIEGTYHPMTPVQLVVLAFRVGYGL